MEEVEREDAVMEGKYCLFLHVPLSRIRDEIRMTIAAYQTLYESRYANAPMGQKLPIFYIEINIYYMYKVMALVFIGSLLLFSPSRFQFF